MRIVTRKNSACVRQLQQPTINKHNVHTSQQNQYQSMQWLRTQMQTGRTSSHPVRQPHKFSPNNQQPTCYKIHRQKRSQTVCYCIFQQTSRFVICAYSIKIMPPLPRTSHSDYTHIARYTMSRLRM